MVLRAMLANCFLVGEGAYGLVSELVGVFRGIGVHGVWVPVLDMQEIVLFFAVCFEPGDDGGIDLIGIF